MSTEQKPKLQPLRLLAVIAIAPFFLAYVGVIAAHQAVGRAMQRFSGD